MTELDLRGVWVPLVTPFTADGKVAGDALKRLAGEYLDAGARGLVALGTTGEAPALTPAERDEVIEICSAVCAARSAPLIVGTGTNNTAATIEATEEVSGTPALAGVLVVTPYYIRPSVSGIVGHFRDVADASSVPIVIYNIPYRTGRVVPADAMIELSAHPNIAGVKQAVGSVDADTLKILSESDPSFQVVGGDDLFLYPTVLLGGVGAICASSHVLTERFVAMIECGLAGKLEDGRAHHEALLPVVESCFAEPNPSVFKGVLAVEGRIPTADLRAPLETASDSAVRVALEAIAAAS